MRLPGGGLRRVIEREMPLPDEQICDPRLAARITVKL